MAVTSIDDPQLALVVSYAPSPRRAGLRALLAVDAALGQVLQTTRQPMIGQLRLAWWREALARLDTMPPPGEPVLRALADDVMPLGVTGAALATMVDGWEPLLGEIGEAAIADHGRWRGGVLFVQAGRLLGVSGGDPVETAGEGWALADLATHLSDPALAAKARDAAMPLLAEATRRRWRRNARALGALAHIARLDLAGPATPWRVARLGWHRITGR